MTSPRTMDADALTGLEAVGPDGGKLGKVSGIYLDVETNKPEWAAVKTGFFGSKEALVPLVNATASGDQLTVPYAKDQVQGSPHHDPDKTLSQNDEADLFRYYGVPYSGDTVTADTGGTTAAPPVSTTSTPPKTTTGTGVHDTSGPNTDDAMTRSEQRLHVGTEQVETGRVRLRKHIVNENVTRTVPVSHEEVHLEREPITDANRGAAMSGADLSEEVAEVTLHAERPMVSKETVPVERVRLTTDTVTDQVQVNETLAKEVIEEEDVPGTTTKGTTGTTGTTQR